MVGAPALLHLPGALATLASSFRTVARVPGPGGRSHRMTAGQVRKARLRRSGAKVILAVKHSAGWSDLEDAEAMRMAAILMPHINQSGATRKQVRTAVAELETVRSAADYFQRAVDRLHNHPRWRNYVILDAQPEVKLALEMAAHEEQERRALEGELAGLEALWREAEEIATIADNLLLPRAVTDFIRSKKGDPDA
jgi:hypothetical protein